MTDTARAAFAEWRLSVSTPNGGMFVTPYDVERFDALLAQTEAQPPTCKCAPSEDGMVIHNSWAHTEAQPPTHDDDCEADFGDQGQENPCRCTERRAQPPTEPESQSFGNAPQSTEVADEYAATRVPPPSRLLVDALGYVWQDGHAPGFLSMARTTDRNIPSPGLIEYRVTAHLTWEGHDDD